MQEKLDIILKKLEEISARIGKIEERFEKLENDVTDEHEEILSAVNDVAAFVDDLHTYQRFDFPTFDNENIIFVHTNAFRTDSFMSAAAKDTSFCSCLVHTPTPAGLKWIIGKEQRIAIPGEMFTWDPDYEKVVGDAIENGDACFVILTNDPESIPQSIRNKARLMQ